MIHRIRRQVLDLELPHETGAFALQRQIALVLQEKVLPKLDELFSQLAPSERVLRIEHLEIDLGQLSINNWENQFIERCIMQISRQIQDLVLEDAKNDGSLVQTQSTGENAIQILRVFLETGTLPWYARSLSLTELEQHLEPLIATQSLLFSSQILPLLRQKKSAVRRLIWQFKPWWIAQVLEAALRYPAGCLIEAQQRLQATLGAPISLAQLELIFGSTLSEKSPRLSQGAELIEQMLAVWENVLDLPKSTSSAQKHNVEPPDLGNSTASIAKTAQQLPDSGPKAKADLEPAPQPTASLSKEDKVGLGIDLAGIVLLGPYFPSFFQALDLVQNGTFVSADAQFRAIHLLYHLATGREHPEEPLLALPKILCGLALEEPVPALLELSQTEKQEAESLLQAIIRNWPALKNTSPDGVRSGFLQRQGILYRSQTQSSWLLRVERLGQDLLLERLPWSISVIKLPWMDSSIQVEW